MANDKTITGNENLEAELSLLANFDLHAKECKVNHAQNKRSSHGFMYVLHTHIIYDIHMYIYI